MRATRRATLRATRPGTRSLSRALSLLLAACSLGAPALARADDRPARHAVHEEERPSGIRVGLRSGVALPLGQAFVASGVLSDTITAYVPLRLDAGYRIDRHFYVGFIAQLAAIMPNGCGAGDRCSGTNSRFGAMLAYHLRPARALDPWLGVGMGFEILSTSRSLDGTKVDIAARGLELFDLELGADLRPSRALRIGPVLSTSIGRYSSITVNGTPTRDFDMALHAWVMLGIRGAFDL